MSSAEPPTSVAVESTVDPSSELSNQQNTAVEALDTRQQGPVSRGLEEASANPLAGGTDSGITTPFASDPSEKPPGQYSSDVAVAEDVNAPYVQQEPAKEQDKQLSAFGQARRPREPDASELELAVREHRGATAASAGSVWQQELNAVRQQQGQPPVPDPLIPYPSYPTPLHAVPLQHAASNEAAVSSSRAAASDSRSDNESLHAHTSLSGRHPAQQTAGLDTQLSGATDSAGEGSADESSDRQGEFRGAKKPRLVWTTELHARFMNAVNHLGVKNAVPKTILQLMNVDGMTRENVASHLQKYRLYLKKLGGYTANAKTTPEDLQAIQKQALQQQEREAYQQQIGAAQGIHTHTTPQGYFGPTSLMYAPPGASSMGPATLEGMQPYGPSAGTQSWYGASSGNQIGGSNTSGQQAPGLQQMASAYGLLQPPHGSQAQQQTPYGQPQQWSWGPPIQTGGWQMGSSSTYLDPSGFGDPSQPGYNMLQSSGSGSLPVPGQPTQGSSEPEEAVPDALAHLLSAAEQASSKRK